MGKNLTWKPFLIVALVVVAAWTLYPPQKTLKPGLDLAGGTSLIYEIDTHGLKPAEKKGLSINMITILRRRIDPANIQNLVWRPQGNTRFEIQMPLASVEARQKRQEFENALNELLAENVNPAAIMRSLSKPKEARAEDFKVFSKDSPDRLEILENLAKAYDQRNELREQRDKLANEITTPETALILAGYDLEVLRGKLVRWASIEEDKLAETIKEELGSEDNLDLLSRYTKIYTDWAKVTEQITEPETGINDQFKIAQRDIDKLSLTVEQINTIIEMPQKSAKRKEELKRLKTEFADRVEKIDNAISVFEEYRPYKGRLDDPRDLQRMLKGAGILEFRILPTIGHPEIDTEEMKAYTNRLTEKGPKFASDEKYTWCQIENAEEWKAQGSVVASFGDKYYVLASNKKDETMLRSTDEKSWKLKNAYPTQDQQGKRAIGFLFDDRAGAIFATITGQNTERPLCILLDGLAISAPNIQTRISTRGVITGSFTQIEVDDMVNKLNAGSLPAMLIEPPISVRTIGPSIGVDNRDKGIKAGFIGLIVVVLCMLSYYTLAGSIADIALLMNILFVLAIMAMVRATFTLPGIAGIILTIGMSVDANVLIFERIREEQKRGSSLRIAIQNGYQKAFSTILDANITTFIVAAILFWKASEEIKGFALVLMLGIISSMFTALFVTKTIFNYLLSKRILKEHLLMVQIIKKPNVNWMRLRPVFLTISAVLVVSGLFVFFTRDNLKNNKYDIEFTGGTKVQINLKEALLSRQDVQDRIQEIGSEMNSPALATANVYSIGTSGKQFEINTTETNKTTATITFPLNPPPTVESVISTLEEKLDNLAVRADTDNPLTYTITTSQANKALVESILIDAFGDDVQVSEALVDQVVNNAILKAFGDELAIQQNLQPEIISTEKISEQTIETCPELANFLGGLKIHCRIERPATFEEIQSRLNDLKFKPDMRELLWYSYIILDQNLSKIEPDQITNSFVYITAEPEAGLRELTDEEWSRFTGNETKKILSATRLEASLPRITQINPSIGREAKTQALIAIVLSLFAIVAYIWIRFGDLRYGLAAIAALVHDVCITLGAVTACTYLAGTPIGQMLLIGDFKINLAIIAAFLTLIGYSLNDTIVVFDRIRENRHKAQLTAKTITDSINQTISRTILTSFTTFIVVLIMYIFGGEALRGFTFAIGLGVIVGTYSSVAIASPILLIGKKMRKQNKK